MQCLHSFMKHDHKILRNGKEADQDRDHQQERQRRRHRIFLRIGIFICNEIRVIRCSTYGVRIQIVEGLEFLPRQCKRLNDNRTDRQVAAKIPIDVIGRKNTTQGIGLFHDLTGTG